MPASAVARRPRWRIALVAVAVLAVGLLTPVTLAAAADVEGTSTSSSWVTINGRIDVREGDRVAGSVVNINGDVAVEGYVGGDVFLVNGNVLVTGRVRGDVVVVNGNSTVAGVVDGSVTVLNGTATLATGARVGGDLRASNPPTVGTGATVGGTVGTVDAEVLFTLAGVGLMVGWWIIATVSTLLLGLAFVGLFPRAADRARTQARSHPGPSVVAALVLAIGLPLAAFAAVASVIALPLGMAVAASLLLLYPLGYVVSALTLGSLMVRDRPLLAFVVGWAILRALALLPAIGLLVWVLASAFGVGALAVAAWSARERATPAATPTERPPAPLPPPVVAGR